ncbi:MAG: rRNA maturation RNase YbeY [Candidatus Poribacteria bacterium]
MNSDYKCAGEEKLKIEISENIEISDDIRNVVRNSAEKALIAEGVERCELSILLTDDNEIRELNAKYRNVDAVTDVLAFAMREGIDGDPNDEILGDIVISIPTAERQAKEYGHSFYAELALLTIHGVLHLLGYDHSERDEAKIMQEKQRKVIHSLGYKIDDSKLSL